MNLSSMWRLKGRKSTWEGTGGRKERAGTRDHGERSEATALGPAQKIQLKQISILNKQSEETPSNLFISTSASRWKRSGTKTITDGASEIFSGSMASGNYLLLDGAANRLKLPLSLCQDENVQLCFPAAARRRRVFCVVGSFSAPILAGLWSLSNSCSCSFRRSSAEFLFFVVKAAEIIVSKPLLPHVYEVPDEVRRIFFCLCSKTEDMITGPHVRHEIL